MKKLLLGMILGAGLLTGCATTGTNDTTSVGTSVLADVGSTLFTQTVDATCRNQLNAQNIYKTATALMTAEQKQALENNVCGCVASEAPNSVSVSEMGQAVIDSSARTKVVTKAVTQTLGTCVQKMFVSQAQ